MAVIKKNQLGRKFGGQTAYDSGCMVNVSCSCRSSLGSQRVTRPAERVARSAAQSSKKAIKK